MPDPEVSIDLVEFSGPRVVPRILVATFVALPLSFLSHRTLTQLVGYIVLEAIRDGLLLSASHYLKVTGTEKGHCGRQTNGIVGVHKSL